MRRLTLAPLILAAACGVGESREATVVSDSSGVRIVDNDHDQPVWSVRDIWQLSGTPRIQVGNRMGDPNQQLYQVRHAQRLPDGRLLVANTGLGDVRIFDAEGRHSRTLTMPTVGDDEPIGPAQAHALPGDSVLAMGVDGSITVFGPDGRIARRAVVTPPDDAVEGSLRPVGMFADGSLLFRVDLPDPPDGTGPGRRRIRLLHHASDGIPIAPYGEFEEQALLFEERGAWIFGPSAHHAIGDSTIWYGTAERFQLRELTPDGRTRQVFRLDRPPVEVLSGDRTMYTRAAEGEVSGTELEDRVVTTLQRSIFADTFPAYDRILVDDLGNVWVRNYQWYDMGSGYAWTVFDESGRYLGIVRAPSLLEIYQIGADFIVGRMATITGREAVYVYGLTKPGQEEPPGS